MTQEIRVGPLPHIRAQAQRAAASGAAGAETPKAVPQQRLKKNWREQRWERRRRRRFGEEILGWILVPVILIALYWAVKAGLAALGTSPSALIEGVKTAISSRS